MASLSSILVLRVYSRRQNRTGRGHTVLLSLYFVYFLPLIREVPHFPCCQSDSSMQSSVFSRRILIACAAASMAAPGVFAAELGDISALSHVGQPLSADIELTALAPDEGGGVAVRLASIDVYQGGGITMDPALQGLAISQAVRDGRRYVHVSTQQIITAGHVHLYFVLGSGSNATVRLATVWLTPAPPAPRPVAVAALAISSPAPSLPAKPTVLPPDAAALAAQARAEGMVRPPAVFVPPSVPLTRPPLRRTT